MLTDDGLLKMYADGLIGNIRYASLHAVPWWSRIDQPAMANRVSAEVPLDRTDWILTTRNSQPIWILKRTFREMFGNADFPLTVAFFDAPGARWEHLLIRAAAPGPNECTWLVLGR